MRICITVVQVCGSAAWLRVQIGGLMRLWHALHRVQVISADSGCSCAPSRKDSALH